MTPEDKQRFDILMGLRKELRDTRELLKEAREWLCEHPGAPPGPQYDGNLRLRWWCTDCSSYLRWDDDYTLIRRIDQALR